MGYDAHLPALSFRYGGNLRTILSGTVLPTVQVHVLCKNCNLCGLYWEDCERKNLHVPTSPNVAEIITRLLKTDQGG